MVMVTTYTTGRSTCTVIQSSPTLRYKVYDNGDHFNISRLVLDKAGVDVVQINYLAIPKEVAEEIAKVLLGH